MVDVVSPLASFQEALEFGAGKEILRDFTDPAAQTALMVRATRQIESRCQRRLAAFTGLFESHRAQGVDQDTLGQPDMPLDLASALGVSQAIAFASTSLVRDIWLDNYPPLYQDLWSYNVTAIQLALAYGDVMNVNPAQAVEGPEVDTGWIRLHLGTFCPVGTIIKVTYDGGYQTVPEDLNTACIYQAFKFAILGAEPEQRKDLSTADLDAEVFSLTVPYIK